MVPSPLRNPNARGSRILFPVASFIVNQLPEIVSRVSSHGGNTNTNLRAFSKRDDLPQNKKIAFGILIPVLVLLSGLFAGLTLGYMSLDETQLHVLSISGTPKQKEYARKIQPIRKNGHLLLITLILANMIVNETLPVISDPVLGGGPQGVVVSTILIVIFSEIIPQSLCTRYGLATGANMAWFVRILIYALGIVSWPVAKILEFLLGSHHGIMYRRSELKELIALHSNTGELGGDLTRDTVTIVGGALDLQEKVVRQAMTSIDKVFMLSIEDNLDFDTMKRIYATGHSRVPVYQEVDIPILNGPPEVDTALTKIKDQTRKAKKIIGVLLVKQCLMLDPKEATPLKNLPLNPLPVVPRNFPLLQMLDKFQEGRSHMAIVSRMSQEKATSVKQEVKKGLTQRLKDRVGMGDSSSSESLDDETDDATSAGGHTTEDERSSQPGTLNGSTSKKKRKWGRRRKKRKKAEKEADLEKGVAEASVKHVSDEEKPDAEIKGPVRVTWERITSVGPEQNMPDDAVLPEDGAEEFLQTFDQMIMPLGIITLEDVLEELIGEEIYDEFDSEGPSNLALYAPSFRHRGSRNEGSNAYATINSETTAVQFTNSPEPISVVHSPADEMPELAHSHGQPLSRNTILAASLNALQASKKKQKPSSRRRGSLRQRQSLSASDTDLVNIRRTRANVHEGVDLTALPHREKRDAKEGERILSEKDKSGPDVGDTGVAKE